MLHALEPLCYAPGPYQTADNSTWELKSSDEILDLRVADIACGSGAFLVAAARYLGQRVVEAWIREGSANTQTRGLELRAIREVVASCLYGADINAMAVEMCKLSLWLVSLDRDLPFSFVDDKVFVGNSLLGLTSLDQLRKLHIYPDRAPPGRPFPLFDVKIGPIIRKASRLRSRLATEISESDPARNSSAKNRQLKELHEVTATLRTIADGVIAAGLPLGGKPTKKLDERYMTLRQLIKDGMRSQNTEYRTQITEHRTPYNDTTGRTKLDNFIKQGLTPTVETYYKRWVPLHWVLEAPDVIVDRGGFDAVVGNPPFLGGKKVSPATGKEVREWLMSVIANGVRGSADLVAFFFLRAASLLGRNGVLGLIATNTVAQGATRQVGLDQMLNRGFQIVRANQSRSWPAASANLQFSAVWGTGATISGKAVRDCDGVMTSCISSLLEPQSGEMGLPFALAENARRAFIGVYMNGTGFRVPRHVASQMIESDPRNRRVLFPFLNGKDINRSSDHAAKEFAIDFFGMELAEARTYIEPIHWIEERVRLHRELLVNKPKVRQRWWRYERDGIARRRATSELDVSLAIALTSNTLMPTQISTEHVFSHSVVVFATSLHSDLAILSSSTHHVWVVQYASTLGAGIRYTPSSVFETFPRPGATEWLEWIGQTLDTERREIMLRRDLGLTKLYNLVNDPEVGSDSDVGRMRDIHVELDMAGHGCLWLVGCAA